MTVGPCIKEEDMARTIETVRIATSGCERINALTQYIRSDLSKATAALRRGDVEVFSECARHISENVGTWEAEGTKFLDEAR